MRLVRNLALASALWIGTVAAQSAATGPGHSNASGSPFVQETTCWTTADCGQGSCTQSLSVRRIGHDEGCPKVFGNCFVTFTVSCPDIGCQATSSGIVCCNSTAAIQATCNGVTYEANPRSTWDTVREGGCDTAAYSCS